MLRQLRREVEAPANASSIGDRADALWKTVDPNESLVTACTSADDAESIVDEYLEVIGCTRSSSIDEVTEHHLRKFYYCSIRVLLEGFKPVEQRKPLAWDLAGIWQDLKRDGYGYCFQLIEPHFAALKELGYSVTRHAARNVFCMHDEIVEADQVGKHASHECILTKEGWIIDVGFSFNALAGVLRLDENGEGCCGGSRYRVLAVNERQRQLELLMPAGWYALMRYDVEPTEDVQWMSDGVFLSPTVIVSRDVHFMAAKVTPEERKCLRVPKSKTEPAMWRRIIGGQRREKKVVETWAEAKEILKREFNYDADPRLQILFNDKIVPSDCTPHP